jgi:hypothetical protein
MNLSHLKAWALALALAPLLALNAAAQNQLPAIRGPGGVSFNAQPAAIITYDSVSGLPCVAGSSATCALASTSSGVTATAHTTAPAASDGASAPLSLSTYSQLRVILGDPNTGNDVDPNAAVPVTQSGSWTMTVAANGTIQVVPATSGGLLGFHIVAAASDNHQNIVTGAHQIYTIDATSISASAHYVRIYDSGTGFNGCNSATNLIWGGLVPGTTTGAGIVKAWDLGRPVTSGISICITKAASSVSDTDTASADATAVVLNIGYK